MYPSLKGNINSLLQRSANKDLATEWETRHNTMKFKELVNFQSRCQKACHEKREEIKDANQQESTRER